MVTPTDAAPIPSVLPPQCTTDPSVLPPQCSTIGANNAVEVACAMGIPNHRENKLELACAMGTLKQGEQT